MEGALEKLTNNKLGLNYYQKRYFRLEWSRLRYFERADDETEKGVIDLAELHGAYLSDDDASRRTLVLLFGSRSLLLLAPDPEEARAWILNLRTYTSRADPSAPVRMPAHIVRALLQLVRLCRDNGGANQEGLFRVPGRASLIKSICRSAYLNRPDVVTADEARDVESTAGAIKRLLWTLPEPLFTAASVTPMTQATAPGQVRALLSSMPTDNRAVIHDLFGLLRDVCANTTTTKMSPASLAICFAPCLSGAERGDILDMKPLFEILVNQYDDVFDGVAYERASAGDDDESLGNITRLKSTSSARIMNQLLASTGGDAKGTLRRTRTRVMDTLRVGASGTTKVRPAMPTFDSAAAVANVPAAKSRPSFISTLFTTGRGSIAALGRPAVEQSKPASVAPAPAQEYVSRSMSGMTIVPRSPKPPPDTVAALALPDAPPVPAHIARQLDSLRDQVRELEERCKYWRKEAETAQAELAAFRAGGPVAKADPLASRKVATVVNPRTQRPSEAGQGPAAAQHERSLSSLHKQESVATNTSDELSSDDDDDDDADDDPPTAKTISRYESAQAGPPLLASRSTDNAKDALNSTLSSDSSSSLSDGDAVDEPERAAPRLDAVRATLE